MNSNSIVKINLRSVYRVSIALLAAICIYLVTNIVVGIFNPDWKAYSLIFDDGAWIKEENRDPGFMLLITFFKVIVGNKYELFRWVISIYFSYVAFYLAKGNLVTYSSQHSNFFVILIVLISFCTIRFTVQIREGIAVTFLLYGFCKMYNLESRYSLRNVLKCIGFFFIAMCIHSGTTVFLILSLASFLLNFLTRKQLAPTLLITQTLKKVFLVFAFVVPFIYYKFLDVNVLLNTERYSFDTIERDLTVGKIIYWSINGLFVLLLIRKADKWNVNNVEDSPYKIFIDLLAHFVIKPLYIVVLFFVLLSFPPLVTTSIVRLLNLTTGILLLLVAFKTRNNFFVAAFSLYIIIDQLRGVIEAYHIYNS